MKSINLVFNLALLAILPIAMVVLAPVCFAGEAMDKFEIGTKLLSKGRPQSAVFFFDKCIKINPSYYPAYIKRGDALKMMGKKSWAKADYKYALKLNPGSSEAKAKLRSLGGSRKKKSRKRRVAKSKKSKNLSGGLSRAKTSKKTVKIAAPPSSD